MRPPGVREPLNLRVLLLLYCPGAGEPYIAYGISHLLLYQPSIAERFQMDVDHAFGYTDLLCDLTCSMYFTRVDKRLGIHRQHTTASASSLTGTSLIRGCECFPLCRGIVAFGIGFPAFCGFLSAFAPHCGAVKARSSHRTHKNSLTSRPDTTAPTWLLDCLAERE